MLVLVFKICPDANMASYLIFMYVTVINVILEIYITNNIKKSSNKFLVDFFGWWFIWRILNMMPDSQTLGSVGEWGFIM